MADKCLIKLPEKFDFGFHKQFMAAYEPYLEDRAVKEVEVDFSRVQYLDSSALGMLVLLAKKFDRPGVSMTIIGSTGAAREIITMANLSRIYDIR